MDPATRVQILEWGICISHRANTRQKGMKYSNQIIRHLIMDNTCLFNLCGVNGQGQWKNLNSSWLNLNLRYILCVRRGWINICGENRNEKQSSSDEFITKESQS